MIIMIILVTISRGVALFLRSIKRGFYSFFFKGVLAPFLLFLTGCQPESSWKYRDLSGSSAEVQLISLPSNHFQDLQVEIRQMDSGVYGYLNLCGRPLSHDGPCQVRWKNDTGDFLLEGDLLAGGQRIRLTAESTQQLINLLNQGDVGFLEFKRYRSEIPSLVLSPFFSTHPTPSRGLLNPTWF